MPPWGVSRDGSEPLPLGHRFSIFRFLSSPSLLMAINPHSSFSQWSIAYSVGPHLKTSYIPLSTNRFPIRVVPRFSRDPCRKPVSRFATTQPDQTVPSPNSQNKRRSRRSDEGPSAGYATALPLLCAPYRRSPERNNDTSLIPQQFIDQRTNIYIADHSFDLREGMVLPWKPQNEFPQTALEPK